MKVDMPCYLFSHLYNPYPLCVFCHIWRQGTYGHFKLSMFLGPITSTLSSFTLFCSLHFHFSCKLSPPPPQSAFLFELVISYLPSLWFLLFSSFPTQVYIVYLGLKSVHDPLLTSKHHLDLLSNVHGRYRYIRIGLQLPRNAINIEAVLAFAKLNDALNCSTLCFQDSILLLHI